MGAYAQARPGALRAQMTQAGMTPAAVARYIKARYNRDVSRQMISYLVNEQKAGKPFTRCTPLLAEMISGVLGVSADLLFDMRGMPHQVAHRTQRRVRQLA